MRSLRSATAIALNTFRETVRDRILYAIVIFAFIATLAGIVFGTLSADQDARVLEDLGLFVITMFGGIIAVFVGTNLVFKEIDRRTIYLIVTKPINRWEFVSGKFLGLALCVFVTNFAMGLFFNGVVWWQTGNLDQALPMLAAEALIYVELALVIAMATFFSTFCTPLMSMLFTLGLWTVGHLSFSFSMLASLGQKNGSQMTVMMAHLMQYVMPDLARLTMIRGDFLDKHYASPDLILSIIAYIAAYIVVLLAWATIIAERREFN